MTLQHARVAVNGIDLHVATSGPVSGPPVVLLHGFPDFWYGWRHQIAPLAQAGWQVIVPDQRGHGTSAKPAGVHAYALDTLADDVCELCSRLGHERFAVVGHDWGGVVAWHLAARTPERIDRLAILNAPHPASLSVYMLAHPLQALRSAYVGFFQLPWLPEMMLRADDHALLALSLTGSSLAGTFGDDDLARYRQAWSEEGALGAMLNWYRAMPLARPLARRIEVPVRIVWGDADPALSPGLAEAGAAFCGAACEVVHLPRATHWLQQEMPQEVNAHLLAFLADAGAAARA
jgi:pimeloyl-ACP methyl ester carboxylesterase